MSGKDVGHAAKKKPPFTGLRTWLSSSVRPNQTQFKDSVNPAFSQSASQFHGGFHSESGAFQHPQRDMNQAAGYGSSHFATNSEQMTIGAFDISNIENRIAMMNQIISRMIYHLAGTPTLSSSFNNLVGAVCDANFLHLAPEVFAHISAHCGHIFLIQPGSNDAVIILAPRIPICKIHNSRGSCIGYGCPALHLCIDMLRGLCNDKTACVYNHYVPLNHNRRILYSFGLDQIHPQAILKIIVKGFRGSLVPAICPGYNSKPKDCNPRQLCGTLHLCEEFVIGGDHDNRCNMVHNIYESEHNVKLLSDYGIPSDAPGFELLLRIGVALPEQKRRLFAFRTQLPRPKSSSTPLQNPKRTIPGMFGSQSKVPMGSNLFKQPEPGSSMPPSPAQDTQLHVSGEGSQIVKHSSIASRIANSSKSSQSSLPQVITVQPNNTQAEGMQYPNRNDEGLSNQSINSSQMEMECEPASLGREEREPQEQKKEGIEANSSDTSASMGSDNMDIPLDSPTGSAAAGEIQQTKPPGSNLLKVVASRSGPVLSIRPTKVDYQEVLKFEQACHMGSTKYECPMNVKCGSIHIIKEEYGWFILDDNKRVTIGNLDPFIESKYRDPAIDNLVLKNRNFSSKLGYIVKKSDWLLDFHSFTMTEHPPLQGRPPSSVCLRRFSTPSYVMVDHLKSVRKPLNDWSWYYFDNVEWQPFRREPEDLNSLVEQAFHNKMGKGVFPFDRNGEIYTVDFEGMTQQNKNTGTMRFVRRRPMGGITHRQAK